MNGTRLEGEALEAWAVTVADRLQADWPIQAPALVMTLLWLTHQPTDVEGRVDVREKCRTTPGMATAIERLRQLGVLWVWPTQGPGRPPGHVHLHAYDPPAPWPIPSEPLKTPQENP
jgi:hypothetical protein